MTNQRYHSWGRYPATEQNAVSMLWRHENLPFANSRADLSLLPFGNGRSYGDSCLNSEGLLLDTRPLNRFISFNDVSGVLQCEAGLLLSEILEIVVPKGWFLPVTPGTKFVTVGGAIANDVHGKNHHRAGTFGCHVNCFELLRSDGSRLHCSADQNSELFQASIGGLGLTGLITWAEIQLKPMANPLIDQEIIRYQNLEGFFQLTDESDHDFEYTVAWVDCLAKGKNLGRGIFTRGNHAFGAFSNKASEINRTRRSIPFVPPFSLVNQFSLKAFNTYYYNKKNTVDKNNVVHYEPFMYPLDAINHWNRLYGPKGFLQYQCVVPKTEGEMAIEKILNRIAQSGLGSFLAVLKEFGKKESPGLMSFPKPGFTLALDFPNQGKKVFDLLNELDNIVGDANGAVYPAKDARMNASHFKSFFPQWEKFNTFVDPKFSSDFWRRVQGDSV